MENLKSCKLITSQFLPRSVFFAGLTLLIALSFFFLLMAENLPAIAETIPIAAKYYTATTVLSAFAYFMTCIVLKCHFSNPLEGDAPNWIRVSDVHLDHIWIIFSLSNIRIKFALKNLLVMPLTNTSRHRARKI